MEGRQQSGVMDMRSIEEIGRELERQGKTAGIKRIAESADGMKVGSMLDAKAVESAARSGDGAALKRMLEQVLSTAEGQRLAEDVRRMMDSK